MTTTKNHKQKKTHQKKRPKQAT